MIQEQLLSKQGGYHGLLRLAACVPECQVLHLSQVDRFAVPVRTERTPSTTSRPPSAVLLLRTFYQPPFVGTLLGVTRVAADA